jgi:hypothetical protein
MVTDRRRRAFPRLYYKISDGGHAFLMRIGTEWWLADNIAQLIMRAAERGFDQSQITYMACAKRALREHPQLRLKRA